jgi:hypothetical protein
MARGAPGEETYTPQVQPEDLPRKIVPRMEPVPVGQAFEGAADASNRKYQADSATWAGDQLAQARVQAVQSLQTMKAAVPAGEDPGDFTAKFAATLDKQTSSITSNPLVQNNPYASAMLAHGIGQMRQTLLDHTQEWEATQRVAYRGNAVDQHLEAQLGVVTAHPEMRAQIGSTLMDEINSIGGDPAARYARMRKVDDSLSTAAATGLTQQNPRGVLQGLNDPSKADEAFHRMTEPQLEAFRQKANDQLTRPAFGYLTDGNTGSAQRYLDKNRDVMDEKTAYSLQNAIDAKVREKQNDSKQDIADRFQDSMTAAQYGLEHPVSVTRPEMDVLHPKDGQRYWDSLQGIVAAGAKAKDYDKMTPEQINADVNGARPTHGGPEVANDIKAFEIRANAADQSLKSRNQDPAQFVIDSGTGWKPLDFSKPDDMLTALRSRANTQGDVSQQIGVNTPLLSKGEQKQFTGWISAQKPDDRVQTLTALRSSMPNDQAYASLMKQIAPGSPLTAIAGSMMDRPQHGTLPTWLNPAFSTNQVVPTRILEGEQILTGKDEKGITSKFPMPADKDLMPQFMAAVGGSNSDLFRGRPETLETSYAAFKAYYAAEASHQGVTNGVINPSIAAAAARGVIGNATQYGTSNLVVPAGMDPTKFEGHVDAATQSALKAGGYSDSDIGVLKIAGLRELGDTLGTGRYVMLNGNGDALKPKGGGKAIIIDLNSQFAVPHAPLPVEERTTERERLDAVPSGAMSMN